MLIKEELDLSFVTNHQVSSPMYVQEIVQLQLIFMFFKALNNAEFSVPSQH